MTGSRLDLFKSEISAAVVEAVQHMSSTYSAAWDKAERYNDGECDLETSPNRSDAVKTVVRDMVRAIKPNIMRVLYQSKKPVSYLPTTTKHAAFIEQQSLFIHQLFMKTGGYSTFSDSVAHSALLKSGPVKVFWYPDASPERIIYTGVTQDVVDMLEIDPQIEVESVKKVKPKSPQLGEVPTYDVTGTKHYVNGKIVIEAFPIYELFVSDDGLKLEDTKVHGHYRHVTVEEAIEMGLDADWDALIGDDKSTQDNMSAITAAKGFTPSTSGESDDPLSRKLMLYEAYCKYDLDDSGYRKRYRVFFGGTGCEYIDHEEIEDYCIDLINLDPVPFAAIGKSVADIAIPMQEDATSILRAVIDNAHMSNNPRNYGDPNMVDFNDLMNNGIGAPIKVRNGGQIGTIDVPFTGGTLVPFLEYLDKDTQERIGVTKAATGLDPDALQSTDKAAVQNTIALSQGQVELMVRNVVETGLVPLFRKVLRISIRHMDRWQIIHTKGEFVEVDIYNFDPDLAATPAVGLGTANAMVKGQTLGFIYAEQKALLDKMGYDNPFTSLSMMYNTLEDMLELGGIENPGRYFKVIDKVAEAKIAEYFAKQKEAEAKAAAENAPMDPSKAAMQIEDAKRKIDALRITAEARDKERERAFKALVASEEADRKRDELDQERIIQLREAGISQINDLIERKQRANDPAAAAISQPIPSEPGSPSGGGVDPAGGTQNPLDSPAGAM